MQAAPDEGVTSMTASLEVVGAGLGNVATAVRQEIKADAPVEAGLQYTVLYNSTQNDGVCVCVCVKERKRIACFTKRSILSAGTHLDRIPVLPPVRDNCMTVARAPVTAHDCFFVCVCVDSHLDRTFAPSAGGQRGGEQGGAGGLDRQGS